MEYKVVRIPDWAYENGKHLQQEVVLKGVSSIPSEISTPSLCPQCNGELNYVRLKYEYAQCPSCGYRQQTFSAGSNVAEVVAGVGLGLLIGWGIAQLIRTLNG